MPVMSYSASVGIGATIANALNGKTYEFLGGPSLVSVACNGAATGLIGTVLIGTRCMLDNEPLSDANRFPQTPEDWIMEAEPGLGGERITLRIHNPTGAAIVAQAKVEVTPIGR